MTVREIRAEASRDGGPRAADAESSTRRSSGSRVLVPSRRPRSDADGGIGNWAELSPKIDLPLREPRVAHSNLCREFPGLASRKCAEMP